MQTAKARGFVKGDYALTSMGFVAKLIQDVHTATPLCEVWGLEHEFGSVYADELEKIGKDEAEEIIKENQASGEWRN